MKKGYVFLRLNIRDASLFDEYKELGPNAVSEYGGKYLIRGGNLDILEGDWDFARNTLIEFESVDKAKEWYCSTNYQKALKIRTQSATGDVIIVEGS